MMKFVYAITVVLALGACRMRHLPDPHDSAEHDSAEHDSADSADTAEPLPDPPNQVFVRYNTRRPETFAISANVPTENRVTVAQGELEVCATQYPIVRVTVSELAFWPMLDADGDGVYHVHADGGVAVDQIVRTCTLATSDAAMLESVLDDGDPSRVVLTQGLHPEFTWSVDGGSCSDLRFTCSVQEPLPVGAKVSIGYVLDTASIQVTVSDTSYSPPEAVVFQEGDYGTGPVHTTELTVIE